MAPTNIDKSPHHERRFTRFSFALNILLFILWIMAMMNKDLLDPAKPTTKTPTERKITSAQPEGPLIPPALSSEKKEQESTFDGFHSIYVYSNAERAKSELPDRDSIRTHPQATGFPYSQVWQDRIVLALTKANDERSGNKNNNNKNKFFVDLASNHALILSNTLYLEQQGWEGLCIEGDTQYWYELARYRTRCRIVGSFVDGREDGPQAEIALLGVGTGIVGHEFHNKPRKSAGKTVKRDLVSLQTVFRKTHVPRVIDYMSLDAEGAELLIMKDFPFQNYTIKILTVERPQTDLVELLKGNGYQFVQKLVKWGETLWVHTKSFQMDLSEIKQVVGEAAPRTRKHQNDPYP